MLDLILFNTVVNAIFNVGMILYMIYKIISMIKNIHKLWLFLKKCCNGIYWLYDKTTTFFLNKRNNQNGYQRLNQNEIIYADNYEPWYKKIKLPFFNKKQSQVDINNTISLSLISSEINSIPAGDDPMERRYFQLQRNDKYKTTSDFQERSLNGSMFNSIHNGENYYNSSYMDNAIESQFVNARTNSRRFENVYNNYITKYPTYPTQSKLIENSPQETIESQNAPKNTDHNKTNEINVNMDSQYIQNYLTKMLTEEQNEKTQVDNDKSNGDVSIYIPSQEYLDEDNCEQSDTESEPPPEFTYDNYWKDIENVTEETPQSNN